MVFKMKICKILVLVLLFIVSIEAGRSKATSRPSHRPAPSPSYRPAPAPSYRPAPAPSYRPAPSPSPSHFQKASSGSHHDKTTRSPSRVFTTERSTKGSQSNGFKTHTTTYKPVGPPVQQHVGWNTNNANPSSPVGPPITHSGFNTHPSPHGNNQNIGWINGNSNQPIGPPAFPGTSSFTHGNNPSQSYHPNQPYNQHPSYHPSYQQNYPSQSYHPNQPYNQHPSYHPSYQQNYPSQSYHPNQQYNQHPSYHPSYQPNHYSHYPQSGNTYINNHYGSKYKSSPSWSSILFSGSRRRRRRRRNRQNQNEQRCERNFDHREYDLNCEEYSRTRCQYGNTQFCRSYDRHMQSRNGLAYNARKAILPAAAVIAGVAGFAIAANLPLRMKKNELLLVCGESETDQALLSLNGTLYECDDKGVAISCPRMLENSTFINDCANKTFECNTGSMDFEGTPINCNNGSLKSKEPIFCDSTSTFNDTSSNETILMLNCFFGELPTYTILEITPLPMQIRYPAEEELPMLCSSQAKDQNNYHNIYKNGFFFYCDDDTVKVSCPKMFSNDSTVIDECLNKTTACDDKVARDSGSYCKESRLYTEEDTICDSTTKYERFNESAIYILNCHEPKENDTQQQSHVLVQTVTTKPTEAPTTTPQPLELSFGARVHIFLLWVMGKVHILDIPMPQTTTPMPTTTLEPDTNETTVIIDSNTSSTEPSISNTTNLEATTTESLLNTTIVMNVNSTISPYVIINDVFPIYPENILLFGIGKSHLWKPTLFMIPINETIPASSENSTSIPTSISEETTQNILITTLIPLTLNTSSFDDSILGTTLIPQI